MKLGGSLRRSRAGGDSPPPRTGKKRRLRQPPRLFLVALGVLLVGWATGYLLATQVAFPPPDAPDAEYVTIPDLRGSTLSDAEALLLQSGLYVESVDSIHHPDVPTGVILGQGPLPGQLGIAPDSVRLTLSLGAERRTVPEVVGLAEERALTLLRASGFTVRVDSVEAEAPVGEAISTTPEGGTERTIPSEVRLTISLGPPFLTMPDLLGLQEEEARQILAAMGLVLAQVGERAQLFNPGEVVEQIPGPGESVQSGGEVRLVISRRRFF